jgi:hypothetical protein
MDEEHNNPEKGTRQKNQSHHEDRQEIDNKLPRPFFLSLVTVFAFVFYGLLSLFFLAALFFSGWITEVRNKYLTEGTESKQSIILIIAAGFLLHLVSFIGCIKIWFMRKSGFLMFSISTLMIALFQLFSNRISLFTTGVYICFILLFGFYYRRFH